LSQKQIKNISASVHTKLVEYAHTNGKNPELIFTKYALERFLYRLSKSDYQAIFILKGAALLDVWKLQDYRSTRDVDFLGTEVFSSDDLKTTIGEICSVNVPDDGLIYNFNDMEIMEIRKPSNYSGYRVKMFAMLGTARFPVQIDVGYGDIVTPKPSTVEYPVIIDQPIPVLWAYTPETVISEKLEAMVSIGFDNTRMKDIFDILILQRSSSFDGALLSQAVRATFERRKTSIPTGDIHPFSDAFQDDPVHRMRWQTFVRKVGNTTISPNLPEAIEELGHLCLPLIDSVRSGEKVILSWTPDHGWS